MEQQKQIIKTENNQRELMLAPAQYSQRLIQCLIKLETAERSEAKMDLVLITNELMPEGKADLLGVRKFEPLREMVKHEGKRKMLAVLVLLVKDFCSSLNVVRNMNEDQMIEVAAMLLEECGNFRIEDYVMMFSMAKKGQLIKIYDRIDMQVVTDILDEYWRRRSEAGQRALDEEYEKIENAASTNDRDKKLVFDEKKGYIEAEPPASIKKVSKLAEAIEGLRSSLTDK